MPKETTTDLVAPQARTSLFWLLSDSWVMTKRSTMHIIRSLDQLLSVALFPIMFLILNRYVFGGAIDTGEISYVNFLVAGILVQMLAFGANYTTINLAVDLKEGIVDRFRSLPMASSALLVGHVTSDLLRNIMSAIIVFAVNYKKTDIIHESRRTFICAVLLFLDTHKYGIIIGVVLIVAGIPHTRENHFVFFAINVFITADNFYVFVFTFLIRIRFF